MQPGNFIKVAQKVRGMMTKNSPTILTALGVTGFLTTTILAVKATPKALRLIEEEYYLREADPYSEPISKKEILKLTWKCYVPSAVMGAVTMGCIIGANSINLRRNAALAGLYSLSETAVKEYKAKVIETIGEKKERDIRDDIAKDRIQKNPVNDNEVIMTGKGDTLCYETLSGRYFKSSVEQIKKVINELNREMMTSPEGYVSLNDVYFELGLANTKIGADIGWRVIDGVIEPYFSSQLTPDDTPCLVLDFDMEPKYGLREY